jgi:FG-GAP-like repeat
MSKRKSPRSRRVSTRRPRRHKRVIIITLILVLTLTGVILAQWRSIAGPNQRAPLAPASQLLVAAAATPTPTALIAKDYIYAGGRLVATEAVASNSAQGNGIVEEPDEPTSQPSQYAHTDIAVFRPSTGTWYILNIDSTTTEQMWGQAGDKPVQGDYDGDGKVDLAVFRPSNSTYYILRSSNGAVDSPQFGQSADEPVPGDYDGDGRIDLAVRRGSTWHVRLSSDPSGSSEITQQWGNDTDLAVPGDYDGDGKTDIATFRPSDATWTILKSSSPADVPETITQQWGESGDLPQVGDFDGDNITDFATWRPSDTIWRILSSFDGTTITQQFGLSTDKPAPGDYDGDMRTDITVVRPRASETDARSTWHILKSSDGVVMSEQWGLDGDVAVPGKYNRVESPVCTNCQ